MLVSRRDLVIPSVVPKTVFDNPWRGILDQWPSYLAYVTSFITIGGSVIAIANMPSLNASARLVPQ
jgi:hypothetical protein